MAIRAIKIGGQSIEEIEDGAAANLRRTWGDLFAKGKVRVAWSQTRGGIATFVSGRMEGELHDSESDAVDWLLRVGVQRERITVA